MVLKDKKFHDIVQFGAPYAELYVQLHNSVIQHQTSARNAEHALLTVAINKCARVFSNTRDNGRGEHSACSLKSWRAAQTHTLLAPLSVCLIAGIRRAYTCATVCTSEIVMGEHTQNNGARKPFRDERIIIIPAPNKMSINWQTKPGKYTFGRQTRYWLRACSS